MRHVRGPVVALVAFVVGVVISPIHFSGQSVACGKLMDGGGGFSITSYRSSYFIKVYFSHGAYESPEKAEAVFDEAVKKASRVIDVTSKLDKDGVLVSRRALVVSVEPETKRYYANVFWTNGRMVHSIDSFSYLHVIEFEKQLDAKSRF